MARTPNETKERLKKLEQEIVAQLEKIEEEVDDVPATESVAAEPVKQGEAAAVDVAAQPAEEAQPASPAPVGPSESAPAAPAAPVITPLWDALAALEKEAEVDPQGATGVLSFAPPRALPAQAALGIADGVYGRKGERWEFTIVNGAVVAGVRTDLVHFVAKNGAAVAVAAASEVAAAA